jgi:hypothetical protein
MKRFLERLLLVAVATSCQAPAQSPATAQNAPVEHIELAAGDVTEQPCVQPARTFSASDYNGPLQKAAAYFSRKVEIKTIHAPNHKAGKTLCGLDASEKFGLFRANTFEPVSFIGAGVNASIAQAENNDRAFGQGMAGYGKRYAAAFTDSASSDFFHTFFFPVLFRQDPRYYRRLEGSTRQRFGHAVSHVFVARADSGKKMFNFSEWLGTVSSTALANTYHPGNRRGVAPVAVGVGTSIASDMGFDVLREFWPEIVHKLKLPFRERGRSAP